MYFDKTVAQENKGKEVFVVINGLVYLDKEN